MDGAALKTRETLSKKERLNGRKDIAELLAKGRFGTAGALKYCVRKENGCGMNRIMVSVGKKLFKRAVKRNLLKRRLRESYRRSKDILPMDAGVDILLIYNTKEILSYSQINDNVMSILKLISDGLR